MKSLWHCRKIINPPLKFKGGQHLIVNLALIYGLQKSLVLKVDKGNHGNLLLQFDLPWLSEY